AMCTPTATSTASVTPTRCLAEICAFKFNDQNQDGLQQAGEPNLNGWTIQVANASAIVIATLTTGTQQCAGVPGMATYTVSEVSQSGWTQTFPPPPGTHSIFLECGQLLNLTFGNFQQAARTPTGTAASTATRTRTRTPNIDPAD
ncbi:MAG: hypothetical protein AB7V27_18875, partial [Candidatus Binatia bacterium]